MCDPESAPANVGGALAAGGACRAARAPPIWARFHEPRPPRHLQRRARPARLPRARRHGGGAGLGGRGPARLQIHLSWAPAEDEAVAIAHDQWRSNVFGPPVCWDLETVEAFDVISQQVSTEQVKQSVRVSSDLGQHAAWLQEYLEQGWDELYLHFVGKTQAPFIDAFGEHVLPQLEPTAPREVLA